MKKIVYKRVLVDAGYDNVQLNFQDSHKETKDSRELKNPEREI